MLEHGILPLKCIELPSEAPPLLFPNVKMAAYLIVWGVWSILLLESVVALHIWIGPSFKMVDSKNDNTRLYLGKSSLWQLLSKLIEALRTLPAVLFCF